MVGNSLSIYYILWVGDCQEHKPLWLIFSRNTKKVQDFFVGMRTPQMWKNKKKHLLSQVLVVDDTGIEPVTSCTSNRRSSQVS